MSLQKKLVIVGDGECGKTCLLIAFTKDIFNYEYVPTVFESSVAEVQTGEETVELMLEDTSGQEDYDRLRPLIYPETNVVLICFCVVWRSSFENVLSRWVPEIRHFCPDVPILLIGTKGDLRYDQKAFEEAKLMKQPIVKTYEAEDMAKEIGAVLYIECSAKTKFNVKKVFLEAAKATLNSDRKKKRKCILI